MKNTIIVSVEFYFKGKKFYPSLSIDLDAHFEANVDINGLYRKLAVHEGLDLYSYEYEVMQMEDLNYSDATGLARTFLENGKFDFDLFGQALIDNSIAESIAKIASTQLSVDDLDSRPDLKAALTEAFLLGKKSS